MGEQQHTADELAKAEDWLSYWETVGSLLDDGVAEERAAARTLRAELERLRELAVDAHDAWTHMLPEWRMAVRAQSEDLYNALGALSTFVATRRES